MCVLLVAKHYPDAHILVCTQSNSAADIYVKNIDTELEGIYTCTHPMFCITSTRAIT